MSMNPAYLLSSDPKAAYRIAVEREDDHFPTRGLITISEEALTSRSDTAQVTYTNAAIDLDDEQAMFVLDALTKYLKARGRL